MESAMKLGGNKTGIDMSPILSREMLAGAENLTLDGESPLIDEEETTSVSSLKQSYFMEADALGSVPLPGTAKGVAKTLLKTAVGYHPEVFINKLGERLAYERSGVRIYDALILKCSHSLDAGLVNEHIDIEKLREFRAQEAEHFALLTASIETLGADPTAQTPDADAVGVAASGFMKVITDPRTSISQSLEAMLAIELADNAAWELLIKLAEDINMQDMAKDFREALQHEDIHLVTVRQWHEDLVLAQTSVFS